MAASWLVWHKFSTRSLFEDQLHVMDWWAFFVEKEAGDTATTQPESP